MIEELSIPGLWIIENHAFPDSRGEFSEWFRSSELTTILRGNIWTQGNSSRSHKDAIRGIHYSLGDVPQFKLVKCSRGAILDIIVDLRIDSMNFGQVLSIELNEQDSKSVLISPGLGHGFISKESNTIVNYLLTSEYHPESENTVNFKKLCSNFLQEETEYFLSEKDESAKTLEEMRDLGLLPVKFY